MLGKKYKQTVAATGSAVVRGVRAFAWVAIGLQFGFGSSVLAGDLPARILIAGDSTASSYPVARAPQTGWGQALPYFVRPGVTVVNRAVSGRSTKSFIDEGKWQALVDETRPGDLVLISFGHNDSRDDAAERYTRADGEYRDNLVRFATDVEMQGAVPVIVSPVARRLWEGPAMVETHGLYAYNAALAAAESGAGFIDLSNLSIAYLETLGREGTKQDFLWLSPENANARFPAGVEDNTHLTELGACGIARVVAIALAGLEVGRAAIDVDAIGPDGDPSAAARPPGVEACAASIERN